MCLFDLQMLEGSKPRRSHWWSQRHPLFLVPLGFTSCGDMLETWKGVYGRESLMPSVTAEPHRAGPYLGPAADEQVQHILTDLVIVFIQKLVNLANSKTSW